MFLPYMALILHFKCTLKCFLQFVSDWTSLKFCLLVICEESSCQTVVHESVSHMIVMFCFQGEYLQIPADSCCPECVPKLSSCSYQDSTISVCIYRSFFAFCAFKTFCLLTHSLIQHIETVPNSKKLQMTTEMWLLKAFKTHIA